MTVTLASCLCAYVRADVVSGRVFDPDENVVKNGDFVVESEHGPVKLTTDSSGSFNVYLDPGTYRVRSQDNTIEGIIRAYPQPANQDVHLKKKK
jgi:hypothetical protein